MTPAEVQNQLNMSHKNTLDPSRVQRKLQEIGYNREFTVVFTKKDGTQRKITGYMESPEGEPRQTQAMPIKTEEGWKSFRLDSVLEIFV